MHIKEAKKELEQGKPRVATNFMNTLLRFEDFAAVAVKKVVFLDIET
jgi:hypothetical protein